MDKKVIFDKTKEIIIDKLGVTADEVKPTANFEEDLGADSLDMVELIMEIEKEFSIAIYNDEVDGKVHTVQDALDIIERHVAYQPRIKRFY